MLKPSILKEKLLVLLKCDLRKERGSPCIRVCLEVRFRCSVLVVDIPRDLIS